MLRRHPTSISLTPEDIATYDDTADQRSARLDHYWSAAENVDPHATTDEHNGVENGNNGSGNGNGGSDDDPTDELKPLPQRQQGRSDLEARREQEIRREREGRILGGGR